jgi:hypothetical protein
MPPDAPDNSATARLTAVAGKPLADPALLATVLAAAHALAERTGTPILHLTHDPRSLTLTLATDRLTALGFLAELRTSTNTWYEKKYQTGPLWPTHEPEEGSGESE